MAEFENPTFDPDGPWIDDHYSFDLPDPPLDPPLDVQQQLDAPGERIQSMRGEIRQGKLEAQKNRLVDTFYNEMNRAYGFRLEGRIDYEQLGLMAMAKHSTGRLATKGSLWLRRGVNSTFWLYHHWPQNMEWVAQLQCGVTGAHWLHIEDITFK